MDVDTIDQEYQQLQRESVQLTQTIQTLATKLHTASNAGSADAKEWILDLKDIALQIQQEQLQMQTVLQALHVFTVNSLQSSQEQPPTAAPAGAAPSQQSGGTLQHLSGSGFGQAMTTGAGIGVGFGLADSVIDSLFN